MNDTGIVKKDISLKLSVIILIVFVVSGMLSYTNYSFGGQTIKLVTQSIFILLNIRKIRLKINYIFTIFPLMGILILYSLVVLLFGVYDDTSGKVLEYIFFLVFYTVFLVALSEVFSSKVELFLNTVIHVVALTLLAMALLFRGISFNIFQLLSSMIFNQRYGNDAVTERISLGFQNVNTLGMISSLLVLLSIISLIWFSKKKVYIFYIAFGIILILNSGSRTPVIALSIAIITIFFTKIKFKNVRIFFLSLVSFVIMGSGFFFTWLVIYSNHLNDIFSVVDQFMSNRLSYGQMALQNVSGWQNFFGIGPVSTSFYQSKFTGGLFVIDSSIIYYLITLGSVGTLMLTIYILGLNFCTIKSKKIMIPVIYNFYLTYVLFENILFIPNSLGSTILLSLLLCLFMSKENYNDTYN